MAIQFRRGAEADLIAANLLQGEPAYCTDTHKLVISRGGGINDIVPTSAYVDSVVADAVDAEFNDRMATTLLWGQASGDPTPPLIVGGHVTLSHDLYGYRFAVLRLANSANYIVAPVLSSTNVVRGAATFSNSAGSPPYISLFSARCTYTQSTKQLNLDDALGFFLRTTGITAATFNGIVGIWGVK